MAEFLALITSARPSDAEVQAAIDASLPALAIEPVGTRVIGHACGPVVIEFRGRGSAVATRGPEDRADVVTLFDGTSWIDDASSFLTADVAERLPLGSVAIHGAHHYVRVGQDGATIAGGDPLQALPLFIAAGPRWIGVASRAGILRAVLGSRHVDVTPAMWLGCLGYRVGTTTHTPGVSRLPLRSTLHVSSAGEVRIREQGDLWGKDDPRPLPDRLRAYRRQVQTACRLALNAHGELELGLTGGKDSRLMLALLHEAGLHTSVRYSCMDFAAELGGSADARVARLLARRFGLDLTVEARPLATSSPLEPNRFFARLANHAGISDGLLGLYDPTVASPATSSLRLVGLYGEALKHFNKRPVAFTDALDITHFATLDPFGALKPDAAHELKRAAAAEISRFQDGACAPGDPPDVFYITQRLPNWAGGVAPVLRLTAGYFFPLYNLDLLTLPFEIGAQQRKDMWFHHRMITAVSQELADIPFTNDQWPASLQTPTPPLRNPEGAQAYGSWQASINSSRPLRRAVAEMVAEPTAPWYEWLDRSVLLTTLAGEADLTLQQIVGLYGLLSFAQWRSRPYPPTKIRFS